MISDRGFRAAAVQLEGRIADIGYNIAQAGDLAERALRQGAEIVALPEFFTTPVIFDERLFSCALLPENPALGMMRSLASRHEAMIGGSYLEMRGTDVFNTYVLVDRDGALHRHRKDQPTMVENAFYTGGGDRGLAYTTFGSVGMAVCWETIRTRTVRRLAGQTDLLMTGSHWWSEPGWPFARQAWQKLHRYNAALMRRTPGRFAQLVGAPNLHAAHCGELSGQYLITSRRSVGTRTRLMGETQITDARGIILARLRAEDGPGVITATICPGRREPVPGAGRFWTDHLPLMFRATWAHQNAVGRKAYRRAKTEGRIRPFDWKRNEPL
jgi:predicted amidohydrolase